MIVADFRLNIGDDLQVVPVYLVMIVKNPKGFDVCRQVCRKDVMERSEMESFRTFSSLELVRANACIGYVSIMHSSGMRQHQIAL